MTEEKMIKKVGEGQQERKDKIEEYQNFSRRTKRNQENLNKKLKETLSTETGDIRGTEEREGGQGDKKTFEISKQHVILGDCGQASLQ